MKLGAIIEAQCDKRGWSLSRLAKESKVPVTTLHGWVSGRSRPDIKQLKKVSEALKVSIHQLCFGEPDPHEPLGEETLKELFSGDLRVTIHKIERNRK